MIKTGKLEVSDRVVMGLLIAITALCALLLLLSDGSSKLLSGSVFQSYIPYLSLLFISFIIGSNLDNQIVRFLLIFITIESLIIIYQYSVGITGFGYNNYEANELGEDLLYYSRPNGLSIGTSSVAIKLLILFRYMIDKVKIFGPNWVKIVLLINSMALLFTFNRTVMACIFAFFVFTMFKRLRTEKYAGLILVGVIITVLAFSSVILSQVFRDRDILSEVAYRMAVYDKGLLFIKENLVFGNFGTKYYFEQGGRTFHLHNSFLETLASNGIIVMALIVILLIVLIRRGDGKNVLLFSMASILQFGLFWGLSIMDIFLFTNPKNIDASVDKESAEKSELNMNKI
ncbi:O-antigen ligase family protein [uncultured Roseivirga sp.]|uniref:O-antigen ligase family protein n=1 Tax=uncultured Roseivirga sp. TaxID=543088 RepID=UPI00258B00B2|nr:O-antigen ligase family protein [uncultured Roseivirga sp.]